MWSDIWFVQLELASKLESDLWDTLDLGRKWLVDFNAGKTQLVLFHRYNNTGAIDVKMDGPVLGGWFSLFNWIGALTWSLLLKLPPKKLEPWFVLWNFFLQRLLCIYKSTIWWCMGYCCHVWADAPSCYLELLDKPQKRICRTVCPFLGDSLEPLTHHQN